MTKIISPMTNEELELLNALISDNFGLVFPEHKKQILESRLKPRLQQLKLNRFIDYYFFLQTSKNDEYQHLSHLVTNNETYFFREAYHFDLLYSEAIDELKFNSSVPFKLRFLSAGCATGEEAYSLNIYAKENQYRLWNYQIEIDAFDIDSTCIEKAKSAIYKNHSLRFLTSEQKLKYFKKTDKDSYELKSIFKNGVIFFTGNLLELSTFYKPIPYDAIFCKNVLIYFSEAAIIKTINNLKNCLRRNGLLFLGHSESIIGLSNDFETIRLGNYIVYRRI